MDFNEISENCPCRLYDLQGYSHCMANAGGICNEYECPLMYLIKIILKEIKGDQRRGNNGHKTAK